MQVRNQAILGILGIAGLTVFGALLPVNAEDDELFILIDELEQENSALVIENDGLYTKNQELTKKYVSESFHKKDAREALQYALQFVDDEVAQTALDIAKQDTASKYWESRN